MFYDIYNEIQLVPDAPYVVTNDLLYADDTVLLSSSQGNVQQLLDAVVVEGSKYGLELNWTKTYQMNINSNSTILRPDGAEMEKKRSIIYLGGMISCDGRSGQKSKSVRAN